MDVSQRYRDGASLVRRGRSAITNHRSKIGDPRSRRLAQPGARNRTCSGSSGALRAADKVGVGLEPLERFEKLLDLHGWRHVDEPAAQGVDRLELLGVDEQVLLARARGREVDGREQPALGDLAVEDQLHVAGALELLEDHLVAAAAGVHEGRGDDRQRAALFELSRSAEELFGNRQRPAVESA